MFSFSTKTLKKLCYKLLKKDQSLISKETLYDAATVSLPQEVILIAKETLYDAATVSLPQEVILIAKETLYDAAAVSLPQDVILFQIITRVPTKSVVRFMCVSKQWKSFLTSDRFREMHNDHIDHLEDRNLFFLSDETFYTIDCESLIDNAPCNRPLPQFAACPPHYVRILTSFHGMVCLAITKNLRGADFEIILWNPVTTEYKRLSKPSNPNHMECYTKYKSGYGLYYCSGENDYKLLVLTCSGNAYIYSLKSDSWGKLDTEFLIRRIYLGWSWRTGIYLNKNLYFLPETIMKDAMRFDTQAKRFHKIETPPVCDGKVSPCSTVVTVYKGSIHLCVMYRLTTTSACIKLWKYIADVDIWRMMASYQLRPKLDILSLSLVHLLNNGNMLMTEYKDGGEIICQVDLRKKKYTAKCRLLYYSNLKVGCPSNVIYTETFVSPNQYMK